MEDSGENQLVKPKVEGEQAEPMSIKVKDQSGGEVGSACQVGGAWLVASILQGRAGSAHVPGEQPRVG